MIQRKFAPAPLVTTWLLLLTQHKPLVDELAGRKGLRLDRHLQNLATHAVKLLTTGKVDSQATQRAKAAHDAVGAFGDTKKDMSIFVFDSLALPALAAGLPPAPTFNSIKLLAQAHGAPIEAHVLAWQADRAIRTLMHLYDAGNTTGAACVKVVMDALLSPKGQEALQLDDDTQLATDCSELLRLVGDLADEARVESIIDIVTASLSR